MERRSSWRPRARPDGSTYYCTAATTDRTGRAIGPGLPPAGSRKPGEDIAACAARELHEETGLRGDPRAIATTDIDWAVFWLEVPWGTTVTVDGTEHDRCEWVSYAEAYRRSRPAALTASFVTACEAMDCR